MIQPSLYCRSLAAFFVVAALTAAAAGDEVVGKLGAVQLKTADLKTLIDAQDPAIRAKLGSSSADLDRLVRAELVRRAVLEEARAKGWDKRPEVIEEMERAKNQVLVSAYLASFLRPGANYPSESDVQAFYDANSKLFPVPIRYHLAQIFISAPDGAPKEQLDAAAKKAKELGSRARADSAGFGDLAKKSSEHAESAPKGGDVGWLAEANIVPDVRGPLQQLKPGQVSAPIRSAQGWHILKLLEKKSAGVAPLSEVRDNIVQALRARRAQENEKKYLEDLVAKSPISIDQAQFTKLQSSLH
jgi:parvulin-like peptidyl-prolyl isomerase